MNVRREAAGRTGRDMGSSGGVANANRVSGNPVSRLHENVRDDIGKATVGAETAATHPLTRAAGSPQWRPNLRGRILPGAERGLLHIPELRLGRLMLALQLCRCLVQLGELPFLLRSLLHDVPAYAIPT